MDRLLLHTLFLRTLCYLSGMAHTTTSGAAAWMEQFEAMGLRVLVNVDTGDAFRRLLAHNPKIAPVAEPAGFDLQLSGDTPAGHFFPGTLAIPSRACTARRRTVASRAHVNLRERRNRDQPVLRRSAILPLSNRHQPAFGGIERRRPRRTLHTRLYLLITKGDRR